ncbi:uncharacterized protein EI90DRAFT_3124808 [Cantharellus anzutake]|uniref:uncharacterized protein n=1 Tax=Cantharellus anzutake TaxID=1750568 RepID=UPI001905DD45|nr:uncharacterized protein EI90DRAFT_3124808 [Cantharellus anzutake]KAF8330017.1 hypothetical protein EI90DRAFT_3124808 [Cantharellus anzutake]
MAPKVLRTRSQLCTLVPNSTSPSPEPSQPGPSRLARNPVEFRSFSNLETPLPSTPIMRPIRNRSPVADSDFGDTTEQPIDPVHFFGLGSEVPDFVDPPADPPIPTVPTTDDAEPTSNSVGMLSSSIPVRWPVVPLGHWYCLVVDEVQDPELLWLEKCSAQGVYTAHHARKSGRCEPPSMELLFKHLADRDGMADKLHSEGRACSSDMYVGSLLNYTSTVDLLYVDMAFMCKHADIPAIIGTAPPKANKANHLHVFLQYKKYPPLVPQSPYQHPPPNENDCIHPMQCITFSAAWLQSRVYQEASDTELHHFEVLVGAHSLQSQGLLKFYMPMWPTSGPMDGVIRHVACWAHKEMMRNAEEPRIIELTEMLQYHPKGNNWQIVLELNLGRPCYMKHVSEPWTHLI